MAGRKWMRLRCEVRRATVPDSSYPSGETGETALIESSLPCWIWTDSSRRVSGDDTVSVLVDLKMAVPIGSDVRASDTILNVRDRLGTVIYPGPIRVDHSQRLLSHVELMLMESV